MARAEIQIKLTEVDRAKELFAAAAQRIEQLEAAISSVRAALDESRGIVARFRSGHNPECECEWDKGAMSVIESVAAALDSSETPPAAPGFGTASPATAELAARATSGGRMSLDLPVRLEDEPPTAAPVPEERSDEEPKKRYATGGIVEPGQMYLVGESDGCFIPFPPRRPVDGETT